MLNRLPFKLRLYPLVLLIVMGCKSSPTPAVATAPIIEQPTIAKLSKEPVTERYEIEDILFVPIDADPVTVDLTKPNTTAESLFNSTSTRTWSPENNHEKRVGEVRQYILDNIVPATWKENGGAVGSIQELPLRSTLMIETTPQIHKDVKALLASLRQRLEIQVSVAMPFVLIDESAERKLSIGLQRQLALVRNAGRYRRDVYLSSEQKKELLAVVQGSATTNSLGNPRLTLFSGQRAATIVQTQQAYVAKLAEVTSGSKNDKSQRMYEPVVQTITANGVVLQVTASAAPDGKSVFIDLNATAARLLNLLTEQFAGAEHDASATIQRPVLWTFKLNAACAIPDDTTLIMTGNTNIDSGDPTFNAASPSRAGSSAQIKLLTEQQNHKHAYLLVCPKVIVQKSSN
jgi:hypothetical protein